jgi:2-dehydropantoate 2-reductase
MRYIIIGAGAIGGTIGARLFESGREVVLTARGAHLAALRDGGLRFATPAGTVSLPIPAVAGPAELTLRGDDVLILAVKTQDAAAALDAWAGQPVAAGESAAEGGRAAAQALPVFCALNGVASERLALRRFRHVYGVTVWLPATHLEPGAVVAQGTPMSGLLPVGRYPAGADETAERVAADLSASRFLSPVRADIMRLKYGKLMGNLSNAVQAVFGTGVRPDDIAARLRQHARAEAEAVLAAAGIDYARAEELAELRGDQVEVARTGELARAGGSSWQSLRRGTGSIEADYLNGEIVLLGRLHGVPAPVNELLQRLANEFARDRRGPGSITDDEVAAILSDRDLRSPGWARAPA